jgi:iron complex outermembrane recepter protein
MTRMKTLACSVFLIFVGVAPVAADTTTSTAPKSLRMRSRPQPAHWLPMQWGKRVAQAPTPDQPPPGADQPPAGGTGAPPSPAPESTPTTDQPAPVPEAAPAESAPAPVVDTAPSLTDEELKKLAEQEAKEEVITVTGSTIERKTLTTPAPLTVLSREDLQASGRSTVGDIIQQLPAQSNAINAQANNGGDGSTRVNIRGLGTARTLTLLNGRRVVPGGNGANSSVDLNTIPLAVIERVEVLKDGASAIYGSDAVGGVVNVITRTDFDGTEASLYTGGTQRGDGIAYDASVVIGHNSDDKRGNIIFSAGIQSQDSVMAGDRGFSEFDKGFNFTNRTEVLGGSTTTPYGRINTAALDLNGDGRVNAMDYPNGRASRPEFCGPHTPSGDDPNQFCTTDPVTGAIRPFVAPDDNYNFQPINYLYTPSSRYNVYSAGTYKLRPEISTFFEAQYLNRISDQQLAPEPFVDHAMISKDSMYNDFGVNIVGYQRRLEEFGPRRSLQNIDTFRLVGGFQGQIPEDAPVLKNFKWELSYNYGRTTSTNRGEGNLIVSRLENALGPSFVDATGTPTCGTPTNVIAGCVPMDILGPTGSIDAAARDYVTFTSVRSGYNQQQTFLASTHGRLAKLPNNGDLSLALGGDFRMEAGGFTPDPLTATGDTTGNAQAPTDGKYNVAEGFAELSLVPISGHKIAQWVELSLAGRAFRYDTFGSGVTWKAGALFRTVGGFGIRGTYSTAFRAPSVNELYQGKADAFPPSTDFCDTNPPGGVPFRTEEQSRALAEQCEKQGVVGGGAAFGTAQQRTEVGGNPKLEAETAKVLTAGVVFEPPQVKGLSMTADYWSVDIDNAIQTLGITVIQSNCYYDQVQKYCDQIHRDPMNNFKIDFVDNPIDNVGGTATSGMDMAVRYDHNVKGIGRFHEQAEAQYLFKYNLDNTAQIIHARDNYDLGVYPKWKANFSTSYQHPAGVGTGANLRYVGGYRECAQNNCNSSLPARDVDRYYKVDLFGSYSFKNAAGKTTLALGVNNLLDRNPALIYVGFAADSDSATYDYFGRFFYARLAHLF